ncbi:MAG: glycosyltransferase family 2 protein [Ignavibacteriales bacterium]|nr:glycosyltransferase family 2 protein [Ignavibacteriales bacterium]
MKISGFTFVRDAVKYGYPVVESLKSMLPLCDEVIIAVGKSSDNTLALVKNINSDKIKIIETVWDESLREGGKILAQQTDIALSNCTHPWCLYLQADEVIHEKYYPVIQKSIERYQNNQSVQGFLFDYVHFYGSYWTIGTGRQWYRREVRIVRNNIGVRSFRDAQGFRIDNKKLTVKHSDAEIFHYGWAKATDQMIAKQKNLDRFWHQDDAIKEKYSSGNFKIFGNLDEIELFIGTHPEVMVGMVGKLDRSVEQLIQENRKPKNFFRWFEENILHTRIGEYKNYKLI